MYAAQRRHHHRQHVVGDQGQAKTVQRPPWDTLTYEFWVPTKLDFIQLHSIAYRVNAVFEYLTRHLFQVGLLVGQSKRARLPHVPSYQRSRIRKGRACLLRSRCVPHGGLPFSISRWEVHVPLA
jgi:hypothetical protein